MKKGQQPATVREQIAASYAMLGRAHAALEDGRTRYTRTDHMIHAKLRKGLVNGTIRMRSLYDDERTKMTQPQACCYCGSTDNLCMDHMIPKMRGGPDNPENLVTACRSCNSSKGSRDMLEWMVRRGHFPALLLLRRYIKVAARHCEEQAVMDTPLDSLDTVQDMPFDVRRLPLEFPPLDALTLWVRPPGSEGSVAISQP